MKLYRLFIVILTFLVCFGSLSACQIQTSIENPTDTENASESENEEETKPPLKREKEKIYQFESPDAFEELQSAFSEGGIIYEEKDLYDYRNNAGYENRYGKFVDYFASGAPFHIPKMNGEPMPFCNLGEGYGNIIVLTKELYYLPWIWYCVLHNEEDIWVCVTYPEVAGIEGLENQDHPVEVIKQIDPYAVTTENYQKYENIKSVYLKDIPLKEQKVSAMITEAKNSKRIWVRFYYKGILVCVFADSPVILSDDFWSGFSLEPYQSEVIE